MMCAWRCQRQRTRTSTLQSSNPQQQRTHESLERKRCFCRSANRVFDRLARRRRRRRRWRQRWPRTNQMLPLPGPLTAKTMPPESPRSWNRYKKRWPSLLKGPLLPLPARTMCLRRSLQVKMAMASRMVARLNWRRFFLIRFPSRNGRRAKAQMSAPQKLLQTWHVRRRWTCSRLPSTCWRSGTEVLPRWRHSWIASTKQRVTPQLRERGTYFRCNS
mmetsp:Transcript_4674/g.11982  ORF Transcript_4674/g.11982 Transcript_4674/m.11982 type:complete len:217 (+) Transcript_4674:236-886(+)